MRAALSAFLVAPLAGALFVPFVSGQTTGTIHGQVFDPSNLPIVSASVQVENLGTGLTQRANTNAEGTYLVPSLPPGTYRVSVEAAGFKTFSQSGITLEVGQNARVDATLEVGSVTEVVRVEGAALAVDTQSTTIGATVDNRRLRTMPLNGRNVLSLAQLLPGVGTGNIQTTVPNARTGPTISISGGRDTDNNMMLDGTSMVQLMYNRGVNLPNPDALQEFRVLTNTYSAEYGRTAGGVFLAVTKSGTNEVHGSLFNFLRNDALNARNFFAASKPKLRQNQFGGSLGGPVVLPGYDGRNRTFVFGSYQGIRIRQQPLFTSFPATAAERAGDFSSLARAITDPAAQAPFPGNRIPQNRLDPVAMNFANEYAPLPNLPDGRLLVFRNVPTTGDQAIVKGDHIFSDADRVSLRYYRNKESTARQAGGDSERLSGPQFSTSTTGNITHTHIFNPSVLNEFRISYLRVEPTWLPSEFNKTPRELGGNWNQDGPYPLAPALNVSGRFNAGPLIYFTEPEDTFEFVQKLSWIKGRHSIKAGIEVRRLRHITRAQFPSSSMPFDGSFTGNSMADYFLGRPTNLFQQSYLEDISRAGQYQPFIQDDFKVSRRLTLNFGLRYELNTPWVQLFDRMATIRFGQQSTKFPTAPPGLVYPGDPGIPRGLYPTDRNDFGPRIGFAFDPSGSGRTSIRGAWGLFYTYTGAIISSTVNQTAPYILPLSFPVPFSLSDPYRGRVNPFPYVIDEQNPIFVYPTQQYAVDGNFRNGYVQQFNLNVQHQIGDLVMQVGYVGRESRKLTLVREINAAVYRPGATLANIQERRPYFPEFYGPISWISSDINADYHSLQVSVDKKFSRGHTWQLAYTFSRAIDERSANPVDGGDTPQDPNNYRRGQRGLSNFHQKHILAVNGVWDMPVLRNMGAVTTLFGGWQLAGTTRVGSGFPFSVLSGRDNALAGTGRSAGAQRPDVVGSPNLDPGRSRNDLVARYFDTSAFIPNGGPGREGRFGDSGRNNVIGPGFSQTDLAVVKRFHLPQERWGYFEFRGEIFNLLNQVNFRTPAGAGVTLISPAFGRLLDSFDARVVQFALRYDF